MKYYKVFIFFCLLTLLSSCNPKRDQIIYKSDQLELRKITDHSFMHISYLETQSFGKVACNGMIYIHNNEALVFDTPVDSSASIELIEYIEKELHSAVHGLIINHHHIDCIGGLEAFLLNEIPSYASNPSITLIDDKAFQEKIIGFDQELIVKLGENAVINSFLGEAHTSDNIISYIPSEKILFGGCMIKSIGASKGNLEDANLNEWAATVEKVKSRYSDVQIIIPGHGDFGGVELLDYTIDLFAQD